MNVTPLTKLCDRCKRRIKLTALSCVCGWSAASAEAMHSRDAHTSCCFAGCANNALIKTWTKTGWANVCHDDYGRLEHCKRPVDTPLVREIRAAYEKSHAFRHKGEGHISEVISITEQI